MPGPHLRSPWYSSKLEIPFPGFYLFHEHPECQEQAVGQGRTFNTREPVGPIGCSGPIDPLGVLWILRACVRTVACQTHQVPLREKRQPSNRRPIGSDLSSM